MKIKNRIIAMVMVAGVAVSLFTGCGQNQADNTGVTTVSIWSGDASKKEAWTEMTEEFNNTIGKEKGVKIEWTFSTDLQQNVDVARQNEQLPDITNMTYVQAKDFMNTGDIVPLEDVEGLADFISDYKTVKLRDFNVFDDKLYSLMISGDACGLIYNKDLFKAAGIVDENGEAKPPVTVDEMIECAKKLTDTKNGVYGYSFPLKFHTHYTVQLPLLSSFGAMKTCDWDNYTYDFTNNGKAFQVMLDLRDAGCLFPGAESLDNDTSRAYFAEGKIGMMPGMLWDVGVLTSQFVAKCDWAVAPYPVLDESNVYPRYTDVGGPMYITKVGKEKGQAVAEAYKFLYGKESVTELYERGLQLPSDKSLMAEDAKCDIPQFDQFMNLVQDEFVIRLEPSLKVEGDSAEVLWQKVWSGDMTIDEAVNDLNKRYSDALKKGVEDGTVDVEFYRAEAEKTSD